MQKVRSIRKLIIGKIIKTACGHQMLWLLSVCLSVRLSVTDVLWRREKLFTPIISYVS